MRVLVTGGAGYVGYSLVGRLIGQPGVDEIVVLDNLSRGQYALFSGRRSDRPVRFVEADILDGRSLAKAVEGIDAVIHLAASVHVPGRDSEAHAFDQVNNWGSAQVAAAIEAEPSVTRAVYLSSITVYGGGDEVFTTRTEPSPSNFYGVTKLRGEAHFSRLAGGGRRIHVVRAGNVYGFNPAARFDSVVNRFLLDGRYRGRLRIEGTGEQTRSFVNVERLATALAGLVCSEHASDTYNFVDETCSVLDVAHAVRSIEPSVELLYVDQDMRMRGVAVEPSPEFDELVGEPPRELFAALKNEWDHLRI